MGLAFLQQSHCLVCQTAPQFPHPLFHLGGGPALSWHLSSLQELQRHVRREAEVVEHLQGFSEEVHPMGPPLLLHHLPDGKEDEGTAVRFDRRGNAIAEEMQEEERKTEVETVDRL